MKFVVVLGMTVGIRLATGQGSVPADKFLTSVQSHDLSVRIRHFDGEDGSRKQVVSRQLRGRSELPLTEVIAQTFILQLLEAYLNFGEVMSELSGNKPMTLLAPWDFAWKSLKPDLIDKLQKSKWRAHLQDLLLCHMLDGSFPPDVLGTTQTFTMRSGKELVFMRTAGTQKVRVRDGNSHFVNVVGTYEMSNRVAYLTDKVLLPGWTGYSLLQVVSSHFLILRDLLVRAELDGLLDLRTSSLTVLAPEDTAFESLGRVTLNYLKSVEGLSALEDLLRYHILPDGPHPSMDFAPPTHASTLASNSKTVRIRPGNNPTVEGIYNQAKITSADELANNGMFDVSVLRCISPIGHTCSHILLNTPTCDDLSCRAYPFFGCCPLDFRSDW